MPLFISVISIWHPLWVPRYLLWGLGPYLLLAGIGLSELWAPTSVLCAAAVFMCAAINTTSYYPAVTKPRWDMAANYLAGNAALGDLIVVNNARTRDMLGLYGKKYNLTSAVMTIDEFSLARRTGVSPDRIWAVYGQTGYGQMPGEQTFTKALSLKGSPDAYAMFGADVSALEFDRPLIEPSPRKAEANEQRFRLIECDGISNWPSECAQAN